MEWLVLWGVTQAVGFTFKPILEDLAKDAAKDYTKDFFKSSLAKVIRLSSKKPLDIAMGKALKEFLQLVQQELEDADFEEKEIKQYTKSLHKFIKDKAVAEALGNAFASSGLDTKTLAVTWERLGLLALPDEFDWERVSKRYLKKVKAIRREDKELIEILDSENLEKIAEGMEVQPEFDLRKHQEGILERYGNLNLESLDSRGYAYNELKLWKVFIPQNVRECQEYLPRVFEIPKEHQKRLKEKGDLERELSDEQLARYRETYLQQSPRSVLEVVKDNRFKYLVVLGDPGSGKSTLLQFLALEWARLSRLDLPTHPIPLLIELRAYSRNREAKECRDFLEFFHKGTGIVCRLPQQELHQRLKVGNFLVMFDGLDEIFDKGRREEVITDIHRFTNDYPNLRVIVTSRVIGYKAQKLRDAQFRHFMLEDLEQKQIDEFIQNWHDLTYPDGAEKTRKRERLKKSISQSSAIAQLAANPLLLTMMAILNRHQELPRDRVELYNQASRLLLYQWDVERSLLDQKVSIDYRDKQEILRQVAFFMQGSEKGLAGNLIVWEDLLEILTKSLRNLEADKPRELAGLLIERLRERNFILCFLGADYYAFVHRTFWEYFCAAEFVNRFEKERRISPEELKTEVFGSHWRDESWHEVLRLIAGQIDVEFVGEIIDYLLAENGEKEKFLNVFLAAKCLGEVRNRQKVAVASNRLLERLKGLTKYDLRYYYEPFFSNEARLVREIRIQAVAAVAATWATDPDTLAYLKSRAEEDRNGNVRSAAVQELARGWHDEPDTLAILKGRAEGDRNGNVRRAAVQELARGWHDEPDTLAILKGRAESDEHPVVRGAAVQELARGWHDEPDTLAIVKGWAESDENQFVRSAAVQELARGWHDEPDTLAILKSRAESDEDEDVRGAAVQELARGWHDELDTLAYLKSLAEEDESLTVRSAAVQELARGWHDEPDTLAYLKSLAESDNNWDVRSAAVQELARGWHDEPDTLAILKGRAEEDENQFVRSAAVQELARGWHDEPDTLAILKGRAEEDENQFVRSAAVEELARGWHDEPDTLAILKGRAESDEDEDVRSAAVQELARGWHDDPGIFEFLRDRALNDPFEPKRDWEDNPREIALEAIAKYYPDHPETLPLLRNRAENDPDEKVREFARRTLEKWR